MRKILKTFAMALLMVLTISTMAFADNDAGLRLQQNLKELGLKETYVGMVIEYLQKVEITDQQADTIIAKAEEIKELIGVEEKVQNLDQATITKVQALVEEASNTLGLKVSFGKDSTSVVDASGKTVVELNNKDAKEIFQNLDTTKVTESIQAAVEFSNSADKGKFTPISGSLNNTATNTGNLMLAGSALIALAGVMFVGSKKAFA